MRTVPPTSYALKMQAAERAQDFGAACRLAASQAARVASSTRRESEALHFPACWQFWEAAAEEARRALLYWQEWNSGKKNGQCTPLSALVTKLRADGLNLWADALTGAVSWEVLVF